MKNWRREAVLKSLPLNREHRVRTPWREFWRRFRRQPVAMAAGLFVLLLIVLAFIAPLIAPFDAENYFDYDRLNQGPSLMHWFGVDSLGRDIFSRVLVGTRISLIAGFFSVAIGAAIGTLFGLLAGYYEGAWDRITMCICDVLFALPGILLAIAVAAIMGSGMSNVIVAVAIFSIPAFARLVRGNTLMLKHQTYIESARSIGASDATILLRHILARHGVVHRGLLHHANRHLDYHRRQPIVSWPWRVAADAGVGRNAQRGACRYGAGVARGDFSQPGYFPHGFSI
ncbi:Glutathione transport system permease protein GsiD|nr:Glutathione transport system permease protein GsiD [Candidatus Pantoea persica]